MAFTLKLDGRRRVAALHQDGRDSVDPTVYLTALVFALRTVQKCKYRVKLQDSPSDVGAALCSSLCVCNGKCRHSFALEFAVLTILLERSGT